VEQDILYSFFWSNIYIVRTPSLTLSYFISLLYIYIYWLILSHQSNYKLECDRWSIDYYYYYYFFLFGPITKMHHKRNTGPTYNTGRYYILPLSFFFFFGTVGGSYNNREQDIRHLDILSRSVVCLSPVCSYMPTKWILFYKQLIVN